MQYQQTMCVMEDFFSHFLPKQIMWVGQKCQISEKNNPAICKQNMAFSRIWVGFEPTWIQWWEMNLVMRSQKHQESHKKWASLWDYSTYHISGQPRLRRACACAVSPEPSHTKYGSRWWTQGDTSSTPARVNLSVNGLAVTCQSGWFHSASCLSRGRTHELTFLHLNSPRHCCI